MYGRLNIHHLIINPKYHNLIMLTVAASPSLAKLDSVIRGPRFIKDFNRLMKCYRVG